MDHLSAIQPLLDIVIDARSRLSAHFPLLSSDFPIIETTKPGYMGFAYCSYGRLELVEPNRKRAAVVKVRRVELRFVTDNEKKEIYPLTTVLATAIHEFSHCITPHFLVKGAVDNPREKQKTSRKWNPENHGAEFYANFAAMLSLSDQLGILILPPSSDKFGIKSLKRFDNIDVESSLLPKMSSPLYTGSNASALDAVLPLRSKKDLRITVNAEVNGKLVQKLLIFPVSEYIICSSTGETQLKTNCMKHLLQAAKQKVNLKMKDAQLKSPEGLPFMETDLLLAPDEISLVLSI